MQYVFARPADGGRVRMPDRGGNPMPSDGMVIPRNAYYERLLVTGDLVVDDAKTEQFNAGHKAAMDEQAQAVAAAAETANAEKTALAERQPTIIEPHEKQKPFRGR